MKTAKIKTSIHAVNQFFMSKIIAVAGVSRKPEKFGSVIFKELSDKGFSPVPINPNMESFEGQTCYNSVNSLPEGIEALVLVTPPAQSLVLARQAVEKGIRRIWVQPGAGSPELNEFISGHEIEFVSGQCILMHLEPVKGIHAIHRFLSKIFGAYPN
jgi:predicted CoA-binding protein